MCDGFERLDTIVERLLAGLVGEAAEPVATLAYHREVRASEGNGTRRMERLAGEARGSLGVNPAGRAAGSSAAILQFGKISRIRAAEVCGRHQTEDLTAHRPNRGNYRTTTRESRIPLAPSQRREAL